MSKARGRGRDHLGAGPRGAVGCRGEAPRSLHWPPLTLNSIPKFLWISIDYRKSISCGATPWTSILFLNFSHDVEVMKARGEGEDPLDPLGPQF